MAETLVGTRQHSLVGELSNCAEAVDLFSTELSADVLSCLEAPLRGLSALVADSSGLRSQARTEDRPRPTEVHAAAPIKPNTSWSNVRRLLQQNSCAAGEVQYVTECGIGICHPGDREIGVTCDNCSFACSTTLKNFSKEICCRRPTPSPSKAPNNNPTSAPVTAPLSAPPASKSSNCGLPSPLKTFTSIKDLTDVLYARTAGNLSLKVTLRSDETLLAIVNVSVGVSVEIDGAGRQITLSDFGFHVDNGRLCLHDVELTGGRNVPALVVLGHDADVNASHVRISNCMTHAATTNISRFSSVRDRVENANGMTVLQAKPLNIYTMRTLRSDESAECITLGRTSDISARDTDGDDLRSAGIWMDGDDSFMSNPMDEFSD